MGKKPKSEPTRLAGEVAGFACCRCGCGLLPDEPRVMTSMSGSFGGLMTYVHGFELGCVNALKEKVADLERIVALQVRAVVIGTPPPAAG